MGKPPGPAPQLKHTIFHEPHATMTRRIGDAAGRGRRNSGRGPKSCCVKVVLLKGKYVRSPASRPPSRCGPSSGKHPNIRTSHPLALECSDVRLVGQETRKRVVELRRPVTVPREIGSLSRMNDDRTNIIVFQQCRDLVFGDWTSAAIFVPRRVCRWWLARAGASSAIYLSRAPYEPSVRVQLLAALRAMFTKNGTEITSEQVVQELLAHPDFEWHEYRGRGPITKNQVAALLRDLDIRPVVLHPTKRSDFSRHGYRAAQFDDAFARFLPDEPNIRTLKRSLALN